MGQNSQTVSTGKRHTPKHSFNATGQRPSQVLKQRKPQLSNEIKPRPNPHPMHHPGKHGSRTLLPSPTSNATGAQPHRSSPPSSSGKKYKHEEKRALSNNSLPVGPSKRPDKSKLKEESGGNSKKLISNDSSANNRGQKGSPKEENKTAAVLPGRALKHPNDKPRPGTSKNLGEVTPKKNPLPNLDLSLSRASLHDDSGNDLFAFGKRVFGLHCSA